MTAPATLNELQPPGFARGDTVPAYELARAVAYRGLRWLDNKLRSSDGSHATHAQALAVQARAVEAATNALESMRLWDLQRDYLDAAVRKWRAVRDGPSAYPASLHEFAKDLVNLADTGAAPPNDEDAQRIARRLAVLYIDAYQAARDSLVGATLPEEDPDGQ